MLFNLSYERFIVYCIYGESAQLGKGLRMDEVVLVRFGFKMIFGVISVGFMT